MQDFLTLAATATLFGTIGFIALGYLLYVWHRTTSIAAIDSAPIVEPALPVEPIIEAKYVSADVFPPAKPKRGRPRKVAAVVQEVQTPRQRRRKVA